MVVARDKYADNSIEEIGDILSVVEARSPAAHTLRTELKIRQAKSDSEVAEAAKQTAESTRKSARYILWSVIVLALSSAGTLAITVYKL